MSEIKFTDMELDKLRELLRQYISLENNVFVQASDDSDALVEVAQDIVFILKEKLFTGETSVSPCNLPLKPFCLRCLNHQDNRRTCDGLLASKCFTGCVYYKAVQNG